MTVFIHVTCICAVVINISGGKISYIYSALYYDMEYIHNLICRIKQNI